MTKEQSKLKEFKIEGVPFNVNSGLIGLSEKQAKLRSHCVKATKQKGVYEVLAPVQFKIGETILVPSIPKTGK